MSKYNSQHHSQKPQAHSTSVEEMKNAAKAVLEQESQVPQSTAEQPQFQEGKPVGLAVIKARSDAAIVGVAQQNVQEVVALAQQIAQETPRLFLEEYLDKEAQGFEHIAQTMMPKRFAALKSVVGNFTEGASVTTLPTSPTTSSTNLLGDW